MINRCVAHFARVGAKAMEQSAFILEIYYLFIMKTDYPTSEHQQRGDIVDAKALSGPLQ